MKLNRRDVMKMSVLGGAALALPLERAMGEDVPRRTDRRERAAGPLHDAVQDPSVISPGPVRRDHGLLPDLHGGADGRGDSRLQDPAVGVQRLGARPDVQGEPGTAGGRAPHQQPARPAPGPGLHAVDVGAPARVGLPAGVRRLRQRHHATRVSGRTTATRTGSPPAPSGTTTTACTTPRRTWSWAWPACTSCTTRSSSR